MPPALDAALPRLRASVTARAEGAERFAVDLETGRIFELNEPAHVILEFARRGGSWRQLVDAMHSRWPEVPRETLLADAAELFDGFRANGFLTE